MKKFALLLFIFAFLSVSAFPQAVAEIMKRMDAHQKRLGSLNADLTVSRASAQSNETSIKEGKVKFLPTKSGYSLRIDSNKPMPEIFLIVNNQYTLYQPNPNPFYLPNTGFAYTGTVTDSQKNLLWIFQILGNSPREILKRDFTVEYKGQEKLNNQTAVWHLVLHPKKGDLYKRIDLWIDGNGMPLQSLLTENSGDRITVLLENLIKNYEVHLYDFLLTFPKSTKIIRE